MASFNKVILMGNLTRDIDTINAGGTTIAKFGLAVNESYKNKMGEKVDNTCFVDCDAFGKTAEMITKYFQKGDPILIDGSLQLDQWNDKDGNKRAKHKIKVNGFSFVASSGGEQKQSGGTPAAGDDWGGDDIPF